MKKNTQYQNSTLLSLNLAAAPQTAQNTFTPLDRHALSAIKGGWLCDDKRRQRPSGGTSTTSPRSLLEILFTF